MNECHTNDQQKEVESMASLGIYAQSLQDTLTSLQWIEDVNSI